MEDESDYYPDWDAYFCQIDGHPASVATDLDFRRFAPLPDKTWLIQISVHLLDPDGFGFPKSNELETLSAIEDGLACALHESLEGILVGRAAFHKQRLYFFYAAHGDAAAACVAKVMMDFPGYQVELALGTEDQWETYFDFLLPDEREFLRIQNRKILAELELSGDNPEEPRLIKHQILFPDETTRQSFQANMVIQGFECTTFQNTVADDMPFILEVSRIETPTEEKMDHVVLLLWEMAEESGAEYDGWETEIKPKKS
jgi:regulator of RNase E activity RraB